MHVEISGCEVTVVGEMALGVGDLARLAEDLEALATACAVVRLDLAGVEFIDSAGLGIVVSATRNARALDHRVLVVAASERVRSIIALTQLERWLELAF